MNLWIPVVGGFIGGLFAMTMINLYRHVIKRFKEE
jgi:hypothetical protein